MDKEQWHQLLTVQTGSAEQNGRFHDLEILTKEYPYCAAVCFAHFAAKNKPVHGDIARLAIYKGDPFLFACFVKDMEKRHPPETKETSNEDILTMINELPNSNLDDLIKDNKAEQNPAMEEEPAGFDLPQKGNFEFGMEKEEDKSLMVMMSFTDWLFHFKNKTEREKLEEKEKKALKTSWQKEKLAAASEEENDEIPEEIFKQAMDSISENTVISESLAVILGQQGKTDKAVDMYKKLSLRNPEKNLYFADRIKELTTTKDY